MWARNCLFIAVCLVGAGLIANSLLRGEGVQAPRVPAPVDRDFAGSLNKLNAEFRRHWSEVGLEAAPLADDLTLARRLSLALTGTVPSLEELRVLEAVPAKERT